MRVILLALTLVTFLSGVAYAGGTLSERTIIAADVTTNTTTAAVKIPSGIKTIYAEVHGTGAVTQDVTILGGVDTTAANAILLCTINLTGTTRAQDACPPFPANFMWFFVTTANTTGTGATGNVYAIY